jgi:hypothetical protein
MLVKVVGQTALRETVRSAVHVPAAATAAVITIAAVANRKHWIHNIQWSYSADPTGGRITITSGGVTKFDVDVTTGGPGGFGLEIVGGVNEEIVITLASGGGTVVGKLNAQYSTETNVTEYV